jgi:hypothetical protein
LLGEFKNHLSLLPIVKVSVVYVIADYVDHVNQATLLPIVKVSVVYVIADYVDHVNQETLLPIVKVKFKLISHLPINYFHFIGIVYITDIRGTTQL